MDRAGVKGVVTALAIGLALCAPAAAFPPSLGSGVPPGERWEVCRGYNVATHVGFNQYGLDLTAALGDAVAGGCGSHVNETAGRTFVAPATGVVAWNTGDSLCLNFDAGDSFMVAHVNGPQRGARLAAGAPIGTVKAADAQSPNGGYAHAHIGAYRGADCAAAGRVPFSGAARLACAPDMPSDGSANQWAGTRIDGSCAPPERIDVFAQGSDGAVHHRAYSGSQWFPWDSVGGLVTSGPDASSWGVGRLDVFVRGSDFAVHHRAYDSARWHDWANLGGAATSDPGAVSWGAGRIDLFVRGSDLALHHRAYADGAWRDWDSLGEQLTSGPDAASWGPGRLDVFARGADGSLLHRAYADGRWHAWSSLGGQMVGDPAAVSWGTGRIDVFVRGADDALHHLAYADGWWRPWTSLDGQLTSSPDAASWGPGRLDVVVRGSDGAVHHRAYGGSQWHPWDSIDGIATSDPSAVSWR